MNEINRVECRARPEIWRQVALCFFVGMFSLVFSNSDPKLKADGSNLLSLFLSFVMFALGCMRLWQLMRAYLIADEEGLRWRSFVRKRHVRWEEVSDYYDRIYSSTSTRKDGLVKTVAGTLEIDDFTNQELLRQMIQQRATHSSAHEWKKRLNSQQSNNSRSRQRRVDSEDDIEAATFRYENRKRKSNIIFGCVVFPLIIAMLSRNVDSSLLSALRDVASLWGWPLTLLAALTLPLAMSLFLLSSLLVAMRNYQVAKSRNSESISVDKNGLAFNNGATEITSSWHEALSCVVYPGTVTRPSRCIIETQSGTFDFLPSLCDADYLLSIIFYQSRSENYLFKARVDTAVENLHLSSWSGGAAGIGSKTFSYRTRSSRLFLWMLSFYPLLISVLHLSRDVPQTLGDVPPAIWAVVVLVGFSWMLYWTSYIVASEEVLETAMLWRKRRIPWDEVLSYKHKNGFASVQGSSTRIRFFGALSDVSELQEIIAQRAVNSRNKSWKNPT